MTKISQGCLLAKMMHNDDSIVIYEISPRYILFKPAYSQHERPRAASARFHCASRLLRVSWKQNDRLSMEGWEEERGWKRNLEDDAMREFSEPSIATSFFVEIASMIDKSAFRRSNIFRDCSCENGRNNSTSYRMLSSTYCIVFFFYDVHI